MNDKTKKYGEFKCKECGDIFFEKKKLEGHIGGAHRSGITKNRKPSCKFCNVKLIKDKNWAESAIKQRNLICIPCKRKQNRESYRRNKSIKKSVTNKKISTLSKINRLKEKLQNASHPINEH